MARAPNPRAPRAVIPANVPAIPAVPMAVDVPDVPAPVLPPDDDASVEEEPTYERDPSRPDAPGFRLMSVKMLLEECKVHPTNVSTVRRHLMPNGLSDLLGIKTSVIDDAAKNFARLPGDQAFLLSTYSVHLLHSLTYAVQDRFRFNRPFTFPINKPRYRFMDELERAYKIEEMRKIHQKKDFADFIPEFTLKNEGGWDMWSAGIRNGLGNVYGAAGVPLSYIIRPNVNPEAWSPGPSYSTECWNHIHCPDLHGDYFELDNATVHAFLLRNIKSGSDAYYLLKDDIPAQDGRKAWHTLLERYDSTAANQRRYDICVASWDKLCYKSEAIMTFEKFTQQFHTLLSDFKKCKSPRSDVDIIRFIWNKVQCPILASTKEFLRVGYDSAEDMKVTRLTYDQVLHQLALRVQAKGTTATHRISETTTTRTPPRRYSEDIADKPAKEDLKNGGSKPGGPLYVGRYIGNEWNHLPEEDKAAIRKWRENKTGKASKKKPHGNKTKPDFKKSNEWKAAMRKIASLEAREAARNLEDKKDKTPPTPSPPGNGNAFGGRQGRGSPN